MLHIPSLNLNNFEEETYGGYQYVLTSPRSLEACSKVRVKPKDLLYKGLVEFQAELLPLDLTMSEIYQRYNDHEKARQINLKLCRELRRLMMNQENIPIIDDYLLKSDYHNVNISRVADDELFHSRCDVLNSSIDRLSRELQRTKGALASTDGPFIYPSVERRLNQIKSERKSMFERVNSPSPKRKSKKSIRPRSASPCATRNRALSRMRSCTSLSYDNRSVNKSAKPGKKLSRSLSTVNLSTQSRDRKILELMARREELLRDEELRRQVAHEKWERDRKLAEVIKHENEARRRMEIQQDLLVEQYKMSQLRSKQEEAEMRRRDLLLGSINYNDDRWARLSAQQRVSRHNERLGKIDKDNRRRRSQEKRLEDMTKQVEVIKDEMLVKKEKEVDAANTRRSEKIQDDTNRVKLENQKKSTEHRLRKATLDTGKIADDAVKEMRIDGKQHRVRQNLQNLTKNLDNQLFLAAVEREKKLRKARISQDEQEEEMANWRERLVDHRKRAESKATTIAEKNREIKSLTVSNERMAREKEQKKNADKIIKELEDWERDTRKFIRQKDRRSDKVQGEKESFKHLSQVLARSSEKARDKFKKKHGKDTFEKKVQQVLLRNKVERGRGVMTSEKNRSSVKIAYM